MTAPSPPPPNPSLFRGPLSARALGPVLAAALVSLVAPAREGTAGPRAPKRPPAVVLSTPDGRERLVEVHDLAFASFERIYYRKAASRFENLEGQRVDIESRRRECNCVRLEDRTKYRFKSLRQIEIDYPVDGRTARLRITHRDGSIFEVPAERLYGAGEPLPPRFSATVDGVLREYRLIRQDPEHDPWPEERLVRILLKRPAEKKRRR